MKLSLQTYVPYDKSIKWNIHQNFFLKKGANAWLNGDVPYDITSNSCIAFQIASLLYQTASEMDKKNRLRKDEKIYIMELASGVGLFAINFLKQFEKICRDNNVDYFDRLQYFFSDFSKKNLQDAAKNINLRELQKNGHIEYVVVDALNPQKITKLTNGQIITDIKFIGIIASYTHDNLPLTILKKKGSDIYEKHIALSIETDEMSKKSIEEYKMNLITNPTSEDILNKLNEKEKYILIDKAKIEPMDKEIIFETTQKFPVATVIYPYGSFKAIKKAIPLLLKEGLYIISDKGYANEYYMKGEKSGAPSIHGNSFAHNVNFPLIELYAQKLGLFTTRTTNPDYSLQTMLITPEDNKSIKEKFDSLFITNNLNESAAELKQKAESLIENNKFSEAITVFKQILQIRKYDANISYRLGYLLLNDADKAHEAITYLIHGQKYDYFKLYNFEFELGLAYYRLQEFNESIEHYKKSIRFFGTSQYVFHNIGLNYFAMNDYLSAKQYFLKALAIDDEYEPARNDLNELLLKFE